MKRISPLNLSVLVIFFLLSCVLLALWSGSIVRIYNEEEADTLVGLTVLVNLISCGLFVKARRAGLRVTLVILVSAMLWYAVPEVMYDYTAYVMGALQCAEVLVWGYGTLKTFAHWHEQQQGPQPL